jgi:hypothetical protein
MSIVLKNIDLDLPEEIDDENLEPVSDEELAEIIEELGNELVAEIEAEYESRELSPEEKEILATDDMDEKVRLYNKYYSKLFPEN